MRGVEMANNSLSSFPLALTDRQYNEQRLAAFQGSRLTIIGDVVLPMRKLATERIIQPLEIKPSAQILWNHFENHFAEVSSSVMFRVVADGNNLRAERK